MKPLYDYISEMYVQTRRNNWNFDPRGLYLFYMVKYHTSDGKEWWSYRMTDELKYDPVISAELGFKTEDDFKKFVFSCFLKQKKDIIKYYESNGYSDIDIICSPKYLLRPKLDSANVKTWMSNVFNDSNKMVNANPTLSLTGDYERYEKKFDKRAEEIRKKMEEEAERRRKAEWEKSKAEQERIEKEREEFKKQHAGEAYYQIYGWPWDWKYVNGGHYVGD